MVWSKPSLSSRFSNHPPTQAASTGSQHPLSYANQGRVGRNNYVPQISRPGNRACLAFNRGLCQTQAAHPSDLHVCAYCLQVAQKLCRHPETRCNPKHKQKTGKGGYKITCLPPIFTMDKCDMDIPPPTASLSPTLCPTSPPVGAIQPAPVAITASGTLRGAGLCALAPLFTPSPSPRGPTAL